MQVGSWTTPNMEQRKKYPENVPDDPRLVAQPVQTPPAGLRPPLGPFGRCFSYIISHANAYPWPKNPSRLLSKIRQGRRLAHAYQERSGPSYRDLVHRGWRGRAVDRRRLPDGNG